MSTSINYAQPEIIQKDRQWRSHSGSDSSIEEIELGRSMTRSPESPYRNAVPIRIRRLRSESAGPARSKSLSSEIEDDNGRKFNGIKKISNPKNQSKMVSLGSDLFEQLNTKSATNEYTVIDDKTKGNGSRHPTNFPSQIQVNNNSDNNVVANSSGLSIRMDSDVMGSSASSIPQSRTAWTENITLSPASSSSSADGFGEHHHLVLVELGDAQSPSAASTTASNLNQSEILTCSQWIKGKIKDLYNSILFPLDFVVFNIICIIQTVPALTYYIYFFQRNFFLTNSSGMPAVWGSTIGAISSAIVGSALTPLPVSIINRSVCTAVIIWEFVICISTAAATLGLFLQPYPDLHGGIWSAVCCVSSLSCGLYLWWVGKTIIVMNRSINAKDSDISEKRILSMDSNDLGMSNLYGNHQYSPSQQSLSPPQNHSVEKTASTGGLCSCILVRIVQGLLWIIIIVFYLIPLGFGANQLLFLYESRTSHVPGQRYLVPTHFSTSSRVRSTSSKPQSFHMHIYCTGPRAENNYSRPTIVIEADANITGFAYRGLQKQLSSSLAWRVCVYDRAGYGWSAMSPLGSNRPRVTVARLLSLLQQAEELGNAKKVILLGHGDGFPIVQLFAAIYPSHVAGVGSLDGFPSIWRLLGRSNRDIFDITTATCGTLNMLRALESVGVSRALLEYYWSSLR